MRVYNRPFCEGTNDFEKMWRFLINDYTDRKDQFVWTIGRLGDWKYGAWNEKKLFPSFMRKNAELWFNNFDELAGFVISEDCDNGFTIFAKRGFEFLYPEMIKWLKANWGSREGNLTTEVREKHSVYFKELEKEGFVRKDLTSVTRQYNLAEKAKEPVFLEEGFTVKDMLTSPDIKGKALLYCNAWGNKNEASSFDILRYEYNRESPCFNPWLDLSIVNAEGKHVAACVAFVDYENNFAEIEKVCSHSELRGKGLAEAVIRECFKRLYSQGIQHAYITGYSTEARNLYGKLGAEKSSNWFLYTLEK